MPADAGIRQAVPTTYFFSPSFTVSLRRSILVALSVVGAIAFHTRSAAAQTDVIRGRIIGPDSVPVERATITVTSLTGNVTRTARTDKNGRYTITFPGDEGDYFVNVAALGFAAKRFEIKRTGDQEILVADAKLQRVADAARRREGAGRPTSAWRRTDAPDISGSERSASAANVSADQLGDLAALAASLPGVQLIPGADGNPNGFSVLGLVADQNATTLNGMNFGGANLPRDANVSTSLVTSPVRRVARQLQRRPAQRPHAAGRRTTSFARRASTSTRRRCSGPTRAGAPARPAVRQPLGRRSVLRADPVRQVVLLGRVSGGTAIVAIFRVCSTPTRSGLQTPSASRRIPFSAS